MSERREVAVAPRADGEPATEPDETVADYQRRMAEIDRLGDEIAVLSAQIQAATYEVLVRLREFDRREGWGHHGAKSCAHWLAWRTSLDPGAAREWVRVARALEPLPALSEAMRKGEVSYSKARALTRIATPETDASLVELARLGTASHIERIVRGCRRYGAKEERDKEQRMHDSRYVQMTRDDDGMFILRARLDPVAGSVVARALDAAGEALYQRGRAPGCRAGRPATSTTQPPLDAESADLGRPATGGPHVSAETSKRATGDAGAPVPLDPSPAQHPACRDTAAHELAPSQRRADALVLLAESALAGGLDPGTAGERYQVVVHVDAPVLADPAEQGVSALADGQHVSAETSRRVACDASTVVMTHAPDGSILDVGRRTRTISPALRRALIQRDGGCRFPGCSQPRCDAHHVEHWADGGETSLDNTVMLCRYHHRLVHEDGFELKRLPGGEVELRRPDGRLIPEAPAPPRCPIEPFEALLKRLEDGAIVVDPYTGTPLWDGARPDLGLAVEWFMDKSGGKGGLRASARTSSDVAREGFAFDAEQAPDEALVAAADEDDPGDAHVYTEHSVGSVSDNAPGNLDGGQQPDDPTAPRRDPWTAAIVAAEATDPTDDEDEEDSAAFELGRWRLEEIDSLLRECRDSSVLSYELVLPDGERLPFQEAIWHPEFRPDWDQD